MKRFNGLQVGDRVRLVSTHSDDIQDNYEWLRVGWKGVVLERRMEDDQEMILFDPDRRDELAVVPADFLMRI